MSSHLNCSEVNCFTWLGYCRVCRIDSLRCRGFAPSADPGEQLNETSPCGGGAGWHAVRHRRRSGSRKPQGDRDRQRGPADVLCGPAPRAALQAQISPEARASDRRPGPRPLARHDGLAWPPSIDGNGRRRTAAVLGRRASPSAMSVPIHREARTRACAQGSSNPETGPEPGREPAT